MRSRYGVRLEANETVGGGEQCWHSFLQPPDQPGCVSEEQCNWDTSLDETACTAPTDTQFCGDCHAGQCWGVTENPSCYTYVEDPAQCTSLGGVQGEWGPWHCTFPSLNTEELCIPASLCGTRPDISTAGAHDALGERWCSASCTVPLATTDQECTDVMGKRWENVPEYVRTHLRGLRRTTRNLSHKDLNHYVSLVENDLHRSSSAELVETLLNKQAIDIEWTWWDGEKCHTHLWGNQCANHTNTTWFPGRQFQPGAFEDQTTCEAGRCSIDHRMSAAQCTAYASCTKQCSRCRSHEWGKVLCYNHEHNQTVCSNNNGYWNLDHSVCIYDDLRTETDCTTEGHTFEACESLTANVCAGGLSTLGNTLLQCYVNRWDQCNTEEECTGTGDCDDW